MVRSPNSPRATISASSPSRSGCARRMRILRPGRTSASQSRPSARHGPQQKDLHLAAQVLVPLRIVLADRQRLHAGAMAEEARRKNARIVEHQAIAGPQERREVAETAILPAAFLAIDHQHARRGAVGQRLPARSVPRAGGSRNRQAASAFTVAERASAARHLPTTPAGTRSGPEARP